MLSGLVSAVYPADKLLDEVIEKAEEIASNSQITTQIAKECVNKGNKRRAELSSKTKKQANLNLLFLTAHELSLSEGLAYEKRMFQSTFNTVSYPPYLGPHVIFTILHANNALINGFD